MPEGLPYTRASLRGPIISQAHYGIPLPSPPAETIKISPCEVVPKVGGKVLDAKTHSDSAPHTKLGLASESRARASPGLSKVPP